MKLSVRILTAILCAAMILALPICVPSGATPGEVLFDMGGNEDYEEEYEEDEEWDEEGLLLNLLFPRAAAEEAPAYALPVDFTPGMTPNPAGFTADTYEDDSITVKMEMRDMDYVVYTMAWVTIKSPTQLRTGIAGNKVSSTKNAKIKTMAKKYNAVVAINADFMLDSKNSKTYEIRMTQDARGNGKSKVNIQRDMLVVDENGDFHIIAKPSDEEIAALKTKLGKKPSNTQIASITEDKLKALTAEHQIINAFTFGPALVIDGEVQTCDKDYKYNPNGREPRMAIGQMDELSYVLVLAEGRKSGSEGATHQELADFCASLGCKQAYNLDGGNSAEIVFNNDFYGMRSGNERDQSDIIYFASAVDPASWQ